MNLNKGLQVNYYHDYKHYVRCLNNLESPIILHDSRHFGNKLIYGKVKQSLFELWSFEFSISYQHKNYSDITFLTGIVEVVNLNDGEKEFVGRILTTTSEMSNSGFFSKVFICEDLRGFLHDSAQVFSKKKNEGAGAFFEHIINEHNNQVESHKRFIIRNIEVTTETDLPYRYTPYDDTFETIKTYILDRQGGYILFEVGNQGELYLDWIKNPGTYVNTPIKLGVNIKSAKRELNPEGIITRIVPVGADKEDATDREEETGQYVTRERVTIESVNDGVRFLEDKELVEEFGIIQRNVDWTEISDPAILKSRGIQYLENQKLAVASWTLETLELSLIDDRYPKYKIGNTHPIENPPLSSIEKLQIVEKEINILTPQNISLKIGTNSQSLTVYQLQQQEAKKSMQKQIEIEVAARKKKELELAEKQKEFEKIQESLQNQLEDVKKETNQVILASKLSDNTTTLQNEEQNLDLLKKEKERLEKLEPKQPEAINSIDLQINIAVARITNLKMVIEEVKLKLEQIKANEGERNDES